jgi:hypothetical protein
MKCQDNEIPCLLGTTVFSSQRRILLSTVPTIVLWIRSGRLEGFGVLQVVLICFGDKIVRENVSIGRRA